MKKIPVTLFVVSALLFILPEKTEAQSLKDILKSETAQKVIDAVKEATALKFEDLQGTWQYKGAACQFKSEELLQKAGGIALGETMEGKLEKAYEKAGIRTGNFSYTFNHDSTFTCQIGKKELKVLAINPGSNVSLNSKSNFDVKLFRFIKHRSTTIGKERRHDFPLQCRPITKTGHFTVGLFKEQYFIGCQQSSPTIRRHDARIRPAKITGHRPL